MRGKLAWLAAGVAFALPVTLLARWGKQSKDVLRLCQGAPLSQGDVLELVKFRDHLEGPGLAAVIQECGVNFVASDEFQTKLRGAGGDDAIVKLVLSANSPRPVSPEGKARILYSVGHDVRTPIPLKPMVPAYPDAARILRVQGTVLLWAVVGPSGAVAKAVELTQPLGYGLDEAALEAVRHSKFQPGTRLGTPAAVRVSLEINFKTF